MAGVKNLKAKLALKNKPSTVGTQSLSLPVTLCLEGEDMDFTAECH